MASTQQSGSQSTDSTRPDMTKPEMLAEIERVSGPATRLQEIREALPTGRAQASFDLEPGAEAAGPVRGVPAGRRPHQALSPIRSG